MNRVREERQIKQERYARSPMPILSPSLASGKAIRSRVRQRYARLALFMATTDALCLLLALLLAYLIRFGNVPISGEFAAVMALAPALWLGVFYSFRLYAVQHLSAAEEFRRVVGAVSIGISLIVIVSFWAHQESISRIWLGLTWVFSLLLVLLVRRGWRRSLARMRQDGRLAYRTLVVGSGEEAERLFETFQRRDLGFSPVGAVAAGVSSNSNGSQDWKRPKGNGVRSSSVEIVGEISELRRLVDESGADCLFVASSALTADQVRAVTRVARQAGVEVRLSSNLPEVLSTRLTMQPLGSTMAVTLKPAQLSGGQAALKRAFDLTSASLIFLLGLPVWLAVAAAVKLSSPGPIFFRQTRVGRHGRPFTLLKFRTMVVGAESQVEELRHRNEADGPLFKLRNDPRVTRVGCWLRRLSLDELPQLINVLRGDMSLVGPRPGLPDELIAWEEWHHQRLEVPPGITGMWQVNGRSDVSFDDHVRLDLYYIENWSLSYDLYILAKTIPALALRKGAY